ncbi:MAG TPA: hypothetical protein VNL71_06995 [Chloroflexota bacterium]|nr:hypothetical protein [Chloroflexota bacterium]
MSNQIIAVRRPNQQVVCLLCALDLPEDLNDLDPIDANDLDLDSPCQGTCGKIIGDPPSHEITRLSGSASMAIHRLRDSLEDAHLHLTTLVAVALGLTSEHNPDYRAMLAFWTELDQGQSLLNLAALSGASEQLQALMHTLDTILRVSIRAPAAPLSA